MKFFSFFKGHKARSSDTVPSAAAPEPPPPETAPESLGDEVSDRIDSLMTGGSTGSQDDPGHDSEDDRAAVLELYSTVASRHAEPVRNFITELKRGAATREWIEICRPVVQTLVEGADSMNLPEIATEVMEFSRTLSVAAQETGDTLSAAARDRILESYESLCRVLPPAAGLGSDAERRENIIVHSLLKQIPGVGHVTFERLYGAGLTSLGILLEAKPDELSVTTGIPLPLCKSICDRLATHAKELEDRRSGGSLSRLEALLSRLRKEHGRFDEAAEREWLERDLERQKRDARQARQHCALEIEVVLAEMGELDLVDSLRRLPFVRRIAVIDEFLAREGVSLPSVEDAGDRSRAAARG